jgi:hypothetical protein
MKKVIKLTESDLTKIVKRVLSEQTASFYTKEGNFVQGGPINPPKGSVEASRVFPQIKDGKYPQKVDPKLVSNAFMVKLQSEKLFAPQKYSCAPPEVQPFIKYVDTNISKFVKDFGSLENVLRYAKIAVGIMKRESDYGATEDTTDWGSRKLLSWGLGLLVPNNVSTGPAQFTKDTWDRYGLNKKIGDFDESLDIISQGIGTMYKLKSDYDKAIKNGIPTTPSSNEILEKYGIIKGVGGTGNAALDRAIISHNYKEEQALVPYCRTSFPLVAGPCFKSTVNPFEKETDWVAFTKKKLFQSSGLQSKYPKNPGPIKVYQNQVIPNFFPNLYSGQQTALGYVEEVSDIMNKLNCF